MLTDQMKTSASFSETASQEDRIGAWLRSEPYAHYLFKDCAAAIVDAALSSRSGEILNIIAPDVRSWSITGYFASNRSKIFDRPRSLRWARKRKGNRWIELQTTGLRIPGMPDWEFVATPLNVAMKESYLAVEST